VDKGFVCVRLDSSLIFERYEYDPGALEKTLLWLVLHHGVAREIMDEGA
jgi:hypothetical protein